MAIPQTELDFHNERCGSVSVFYLDAVTKSHAGHSSPEGNSCATSQSTGRPCDHTTVTAPQFRPIDKE